MREWRGPLKYLVAALWLMILFSSASLNACTAFIVRQGDRVLIGNNEVGS